MTNGKRASFEASVGPHVPELYGVAVRLTRCRAEADDVLQEAMTRAWAFWDRFDAGGNPRAWMHRILFNTFASDYRRRKREREILGQATLDDAEGPHWSRGARATADGGATFEHLSDEVVEALAALPEPFREVVELVDLRGDSYKEAAARIGRPVGTVMSRLHRGRRLLREALRGFAVSEGYLAPTAA